MIVEKAKSKIVCDITGCNNTAKFLIKKTSETSNGESVKLCDSCAKELYQTLLNEYLKGKNNEKKHK